MIPRPLALAVLGSLALPSLVHAQYQELNLGAAGWLSGAWSTADFGPRVATGYFTPGLELDAVVLDGTTPGLLVAPESFLTRIDAPVSALDLATRPGIGGPDTLLTVGSGGLIESTWDAENEVWTTNALNSTTWAGARRLLVGDLDGSGELDVVALASAARVVRVLHGTSSGFDSAETFETVFPAYDMALMNWDGDANGVQEIAVLTSYGIEVYDHSGTLLDDLNLTYSTLKVATIGDFNNDEDRLACVVSDPVTPGRQWLVNWGKNGVEGPFFLGDDLDFRTIQSLDWDGDGDLDVVLRLGTEIDGYIFINEQTASTPTFDTGSGYSVDLLDVSDPSLCNSGFGVGDFDHDGDLDLLAPVQGDYDGGPLQFGETLSNVQLARNFTIDEDDFKLAIYAVEQTLYSATPDVELRLFYDGPAEMLDFDPQTEELHVEYSVWQMDDIFAALDPDPFLTGDFEYAGGYAEVAFWLGQASNEFDDLYAIRIRQVVRDESTGDLLRLGPAQSDVYASNDPEYATISSLPQTSSGVPAVQFEIPENPDGTSGGGVGMGTGLPPHEGGDAPRGGEGG